LSDLAISNTPIVSSPAEDDSLVLDNLSSPLLISSAPSDLIFRPFVIREELRCMNAAESKPEDLPGRYGRTIADLKRLLQAIETLSVVAGGWAVWHHGMAGRVTEDIHIVVAQDSIEDLKRHATTFGF